MAQHKITIAVWQQLRRGIETEGKAKVVASVWGMEFVQFIVTVDVLPRSIWKKQLARQGIEQILPLQTDATTFVLHSVSILLLWAAITLKSWPET